MHGSVSNALRITHHLLLLLLLLLRVPLPLSLPLPLLLRRRPPCFGDPGGIALRHHGGLMHPSRGRRRRRLK